MRELRNVVEATLAMGEATELAGPSSRPGASPSARPADLDLTYKDARRALLDDFERRYVERLLARTGGNVSAAAREAQMDRTYLIKLVSRHGLK